MAKTRQEKYYCLSIFPIFLVDYTGVRIYTIGGSVIVYHGMLGQSVSAVPIGWDVCLPAERRGVEKQHRTDTMDVRQHRGAKAPSKIWAVMTGPPSWRPVHQVYRWGTKILHQYKRHDHKETSATVGAQTEQEGRCWQTNKFIGGWRCSTKLA